MTIITAIMAGGLGKRMNTGIPKVLNLVKNKPMICHVIDQALSVGSKYILIIVGKFGHQIKLEISIKLIIIFYQQIFAGLKNKTLNSCLCN
jgi:bifunctional N-acetylglucosamine-1-phosphate-uridyltransferase/glucosamine-1-phosphate-acetyltransferase GlmU-like protein